MSFLWICIYCFSKTFELQGFKQLIDQVAESKKTTADQIISKISSTGGPSLANVTVSCYVYKNIYLIYLYIIGHGK